MRSMELILERSYLDNGTFGKLYFNGRFICYTVERPWNNNKKGISCIPEGTYDIQHYTSERYDDNFILVNHDLGVGWDGTQRTRILIHIANFVDDVEGCIGVGLELHQQTWGVAHSKLAMDVVRKLINEHNIATITIK